ncbi:U-box domain-containing protein 33-like isoform X2 [Rutidosis leptorrhynchoides]
MWIEANNVETGIVETITKHGIKRLVIGAANEKLYSKDMAEPTSNKAIYVSQHAPISCKIWFACKGHLIHTREKPASPTSGLKSIVALYPSSAAEETASIRYHEPHADVAVNSVRSSENSTSTENDSSTSTSTQLMINDATENGLTLTSSHEETALILYDEAHADMAVNSVNDFSTSTSTQLMINDATRSGLTLTSPNESQDQLVHSISTMFLGLSSSELQDKLEYAATDAKNLKQKAFEESIERWRAEEDAKDALSKAEESESSCKEEVSRREEMEAILATKSQEIEKMKSQRAKYIEQLQIVKDQTPELVNKISNARETERELEEKIVEAVNLLITFKERRDNLQEKRDNARREISRLSKYEKNEENTIFSHAQFYKPSILEIMEATQDFNQSLKIGEGRHGCVYKGTLRHVRVAIKMLPSVGFLCDAEFEYEAEVLSRIRHPNIVTLIGVSPETRSLIYEYLENGNLEDLIASSTSNSSLPWHTRIKIASEICSALIFLHNSKPQIIHGNIKLTNILLDSNHVSKLTDLGISNLIFCKDQDNVSACSDPEHLESGKISVSSDIYSFGVVLLSLLTGRPDSSVLKDTKCALENGNFGTILDSTGGDWPIDQAKELAYLSLRCCEKNSNYRPDLVDDILKKLEIMGNLFTESPVESSENNNRQIPSYFVCPIFQEVMKDPYIAADGFTYEEDAIKGWLNSGHKTSPMTNLKLDHCDLIPNHALSFAIQEWLQHS